MSSKDGGPAFPVIRHTIDELGGQHTEALSVGMSLRDHFAGQALASELNTSMEDERFKLLVETADAGHEPVANVIAHECYAMADAMLAERDKT